MPSSVVARLLQVFGHGSERVEPEADPPAADSLLVWVCTLINESRVGRANSRSTSTASTISAAGGLIQTDEPITIFRLELERLQYILHFPEEVAFQLSISEYQLFYSIQPMDYVRYVSCDLTSVPVIENPSPVKGLVKRLSEVSSWITHVIVSQPTHDDRKIALTAIMRVVETCWNIGNFNGAVEILMGLKSEKLRPFWLSLRQEEKCQFEQLIEEKRQYEEMCEALLPAHQSLPSTEYTNAVQRALRMPQCHLVPFFGVFLRDLYAIVNDMPNIVVIGQEGQREKLEFLNDPNGEDHFSSRIGVGGLLNADKINLVAIVLDNLEVFHRHNRNMIKHMEHMNAADNNDRIDEHCELKAESFEPVNPIRDMAHGVTFIPLDSHRFDLDVIQRLLHGTTVIHYDPDTGRSTLCRMRLDPSCALLSWKKISYASPRDPKENMNSKASVQALQAAGGSDGRGSGPMQNAGGGRAGGSGPVSSGLDEGELKLTMVKNVENVDSYDVDIEAIYRRHSVEEMSVPVNCWRVSFGQLISDNDFLYFLAPQQIASLWMSGLQKVVSLLHIQQNYPDRRILWLKTLYLQLYKECLSESQGLSGEAPAKIVGPRPYDALTAFGGRVESWRGFGTASSVITTMRPTDSSSANELGSSRNRFKLKNFKIAMKNKLRGTSRDGSRSQSPQPQSPLVRPPSIKSQMSSQSGPPGPNSPGYLLKPRGDTAMSDTGDLDSIYTPRSRTPTSSSYGDQSTMDSSETAQAADYLDSETSSQDFSITDSPAGRSVGGRSTKSWRSRGGETPNSGSISSSGQVSGLNGPSGKEFQEKPLTLLEFVELFRLFYVRMRKDLRDIFNDVQSAANAIAKREREKHSPRMQSRIDSSSSPLGPDFLSNDFLTRNTQVASMYIGDKQMKIYNALTVASISKLTGGGGIDTSRSNVLTPAMLKHFICTQQMELIDEAYSQQLIQEHEPDPVFRQKAQMTFEGFVRYLSDPSNFAFVPENIRPDESSLTHPLSYYYINSSHNTYLTGHQLKGESSAEMYRQVLLTGCRCVELDCWDGDDGLPLIYHGHTFTSKIAFRQVVEIIKKSAFVTSDLPIILSLENHCSLQQQAKMAQMFKTILGDLLVSQFLFEADYSENPHLPSPNQLRKRILIKNKKLICEPTYGLSSSVTSASTPRNDRDLNQVTLRRKQSKNSYESSTADDVEDDDYDEFDDEDAEEEDADDRTDTESPKTASASGGGGGSSNNGGKRSTAGQAISEAIVVGGTAAGHGAGTSGRSASAKAAASTSAPAAQKQDSVGSEHSDGAATPAAAPPSKPPGTQSVPTISTSGMNKSPVSTVRGGLPTALLPPQFDIKVSQPCAADEEPYMMKARKQQSGVVAPELSDLVGYTQAVKFKGFPPIDTTATAPSTSRSTGEDAMATSSFAMPQPPSRTRTSTNLLAASSPRRPRGSNNHPPSDSDTISTISARPNVSASCYQVVSLNEASARKLCRKHPFKSMAYCRDHIMRTYPGAMRIDSSNFNPIHYWAYGMQMVALNFQTSDVMMAVNAAMFEQSGNCGYTLKPRLLWDETHPLHRKFIPLSKELVTHSGLLVHLTVISGQHLMTSNYQASLFVEIELIGVPADSYKEKTKPSHRNAVNPTWNHTVSFRVSYVELAFLRIAVCDTGQNGRVVSQRVVPVRCIRPGYRHLPMRTPSNQPLDSASLFLRTRFEQEEHIYLHDEDSRLHCNVEHALAYMNDPHIKASPPLKKQIFVVRINGLQSDDAVTVVHGESGSTVRQIIQQALINAGKSSDSAEDYVLIEETVAGAPPPPSGSSSIGGSASAAAGGSSGAGASSSVVGLGAPGADLGDVDDMPPEQRVLPPLEPIMDAVACWNGSMRKFIIRKKGSDPSSRAWISSIIKSGATASTSAITTVPPLERRLEHAKSQSSSQIHGRSLDVDACAGLDTLDTPGMQPRAHSMAETFLVCVHNVSEDQPYAILRASVLSTATDIIRQVFLKARRLEADEADFVLVEETADEGEFGSAGGGSARQGGSSMGGIVGFSPVAASVNARSGAPARTVSRVLRADENVWKAQTRWRSFGRFVLENRKETVAATLEKVRSFMSQLDSAREHHERELAKAISAANACTIGPPGMQPSSGSAARKQPLPPLKPATAPGPGGPAPGPSGHGAIQGHSAAAPTAQAKSKESAPKQQQKKHSTDTDKR